MRFEKSPDKIYYNVSSMGSEMIMIVGIGGCCCLAAVSASAAAAYMMNQSQPNVQQGRVQNNNPGKTAKPAKPGNPNKWAVQLENQKITYKSCDFLGRSFNPKKKEWVCGTVRIAGKDRKLWDTGLSWESGSEKGKLQCAFKKECTDVARAKPADGSPEALAETAAGTVVTTTTLPPTAAPTTTAATTAAPVTRPPECEGKVIAKHDDGLCWIHEADGTINPIGMCGPC